jgi:cellulose 1,4-beta-cellobiosidase
VNSEWSAQASADGGSAIANQPTAVWLDRIAAINGVNGGMGLRDHLDAALAQGASYAQFVIYDLPGRDCAALASNGELGPTDLTRYQQEYIDPIAAIMADSKYANLKIINVIEPDSLPNLVTNADGQAGATAACATMKQNGNYVKGVQYALNKLHAISNVYNYIDAGHHGWLGWDDNFTKAAQMFADTARGTTAGAASVDGFIVNTANYSPTKEPFLTVNDQTRQSKWIDWNRYVDEQSFATAFRNQLVSSGLNSNIGMLIDTSRNGWGGPNRPTKASTASDVNQMVNESRVDRRPHVGDWCNQSGSGLGERPTAAPASGIDAYVWVKPPGESDGASSQIPNDEGKGFDQMCDPNYGGNARNGNSPTNAMPNAPLSGHWFSAMFRQLLQNAYPPL